MRLIGISLKGAGYSILQSGVIAPAITATSKGSGKCWGARQGSDGSQVRQDSSRGKKVMRNS